MDDGIIHVVDDDSAMRDALQDLLESFGFRVVTYSSAAEFIQRCDTDLPACLILDVVLPGLTGLELQRQLASTPHPPIVFITGQGDIPSSVQAMKAGAVDFLQKPFDHAELLSAIHTALSRDRDAHQARDELRELRRRHALLTPREREVLPLVISGRLNKQAAADLGISEVTYQIHRGQVMRKLEAGSLCGLVRIAAKLGVCPSAHSAPRAVRRGPVPRETEETRDQTA